MLQSHLWYFEVKFLKSNGYINENIHDRLNDSYLSIWKIYNDKNTCVKNWKKLFQVKNKNFTIFEI